MLWPARPSRPIVAAGGLGPRRIPAGRGGLPRGDRPRVLPPPRGAQTGSGGGGDIRAAREPVPPRGGGADRRGEAGRGGGGGGSAAPSTSVRARRASGSGHARAGGAPGRARGDA